MFLYNKQVRQYQLSQIINIQKKSSFNENLSYETP